MDEIKYEMLKTFLGERVEDLRRKVGSQKGVVRMQTVAKAEAFGVVMGFLQRLDKEGEQ
jgi:hypothetical protein